MAGVEKGLVKVNFAGAERLLRVELGLAVEIENRTGKSVVELVQAAFSQTLRVRDMIVIYQAAMAANGVELSEADTIAAIQKLGFVKSLLHAGLILNALFAEPGEGSASAKKPKSKQEAATL